MRHKQIQARELGLAQLRILLTLSRELLQTDETDRSLVLVGRALVDMVRPRSALLVLRGDRNDAVGLDSRGMPAPAGSSHPLHQAAMALLSDLAHAPLGKPLAAEPLERAGPRVLVLAVPAHGAVAALAADWEHDLGPGELDGCRRAMSFILELTVAALGKIEARCLLERRVSDQGDQIASTSQAHAAELAQRDETATELHLLSLTDVLTGLYNRRGFFVQADRMFKVSQRQRTPSAVIFADIDGLKRVNDQLGHDMGDQLIRDAAHVLRQSFRQADVLSRLGGDEFVAFTLDDEQPDVILERIQTNLHAFNLMQERPYAVSISAGIVQCDPGAGQSLAHYVLLADEKMYAQKRSRLH
jgi:diguanylate cyclase (GGDEF)-like protein